METRYSDVLNALERLMRMFQIERLLYLLTTTVSFVIFVFVAYKMLIAPKMLNEGIIGAMLGASGIATAASLRISWFLNKAFGLIDFLVRNPPPADASRPAGPEGQA